MELEFVFKEMNTKQQELFIWLLEQDEELEKSLAIVCGAVAAVKSISVINERNYKKIDPSLQKKWKSKSIPFNAEI